MSDPTPSSAVLIVEDDADFAAYLAAVVRRTGLAVAVAGDGSEARAYLELHRPVLVTLDMELPDDSGAQIFVALRSDPRLRGVAIVVITGVPLDHPELQQLMRTFVDQEHLPLPDAYLEKPVSPDRLLEVVEGALRRVTDQHGRGSAAGGPSTD